MRLEKYLANIRYLTSKMQQIKRSLEETLTIYDSIELDTAFKSQQISSMGFAVQHQRDEVNVFLNLLDRLKSQIEADLHMAREL